MDDKDRIEGEEASHLLPPLLRGGFLRDGGGRVRRRAAGRLSEDVASLLGELLETVRDGAALRVARLLLLLREPLLLFPPLGIQQLHAHVLLHLTDRDGLAADGIHHHQRLARGSSDARLVVRHHLDVLVQQVLVDLHGPRGRGVGGRRAGEDHSRRRRGHQGGRGEGCRGDWGRLEQRRRRRQRIGFEAAQFRPLRVGELRDMSIEVRIAAAVARSSGGGPRQGEGGEGRGGGDVHVEQFVFGEVNGLHDGEVLPVDGLEGQSLLVGRGVLLLLALLLHSVVLPSLQGQLQCLLRLRKLSYPLRLVRRRLQYLGVRVDQRSEVTE